MKRIGLITSLILLLALAGCKSKELTGNEQKANIQHEKNRFEELINSYGKWDSFVSKATASFADSRLRSSVEIRMVRGKAVQVSIRPLLGIEIGRLLMTTDSVFIYDKYNRRYVAESLQEFSHVLPVDISPLDLQNVLLGRLFIFGKENLTANDQDDFDFLFGENGDWALQPQQQYKNFTYRFLLNNKFLMGIQAVHNNSTKQIICSYANQKYISNRILPSFVQITAQGNSHKYTLNVNYDASSASWNDNISIQKLPIDGYSRMSFSQLYKSLIP